MPRYNIYQALLASAMAISTMVACAKAPSTERSVTESMRDNPLLGVSPHPFQVPPFDKIRNEDFRPGLLEGIAQQRAEIAQIADNQAAPTFANTLEALEQSGQLLTRATLAFNLLAGANTNEVLQALSEEIAPHLAAVQDAIYLNSKLFARVDAVYRQSQQTPLEPEAQHLVAVQHKAFVLAGARLSDADKDKLKALNGEEAALGAKFTNQLLAATKSASLGFTQLTELAGMSAADVETAAHNASKRGKAGSWLVDLQNTTQQPALQSLANRQTRQKLFDAGWTRTERGDANDTRPTIVRLATLRAEKAQLLGFANYASWRLQDQMAQSPDLVEQLFAQLVPAGAARARAEAADIQTRINYQGGNFALQPWDWDFYAEQVRHARYDLNEADIKPYFELNRVLADGVFYAATQLYGITFVERHDLPVYHPDVRVFEVFEQDGRHLGIFYADYFTRNNKSGGAWMSNLINQSTLLKTQPVIYNVMNITKPVEGQPALLTFDEVSTMFHEFGHGLHGLFANQRFPSLSGTSVARDFVEFPSQFNEHWAVEPNVFAHYAVHHETHAPMPAELVTKLHKAAQFNQGYALTEILAASQLDMAWHQSVGSVMDLDVDQFEKQVLKLAHLDLPQVPPRYRSSYFLHIWGNGYAAAYYAYTWTRVLGDDAYAWFDENGGLSRANGQRFRDMILSRGNTGEYAQLFRAFRGRDPSIEPMLKHYGLD